MTYGAVAGQKQRRASLNIRENCPSQFTNNNTDPGAEFESDDVGWDLHNGERNGVACCMPC